MHLLIVGKKTVKKLLLILIAAALAAAGVAASAATATNTFPVTINMSSACEVVTVPTIAFTYTSFQAAAATASSTFTVRCTNTKTITSVRLDDGAGGIATGLTQAYTDLATGLGYSLTLAGVPTAGTGTAQTINISGSMAGGQSGTCATATCDNTASTNRVRTITVTY